LLVLDEDLKLDFWSCGWIFVNPSNSKYPTFQNSLERKRKQVAFPKSATKKIGVCAFTLILVNQKIKLYPAEHKTGRNDFPKLAQNLLLKISVTLENTLLFLPFSPNSK
jgi:hypothetical protein